MSNYIDLHCHVLPGLDDGAKDLQAAVTLVQQMEELGFLQICPTPHQKQGSWTPEQDEITQAAEMLREALASAGSRAVILPPAAENMWDGLFLERLEGEYPTYPGEKAFLVEFSPQAVPPRLKERFYEFRLAGRLPVVAHVERYGQLVRDHDLLEDLAQGAALLINLSSLGSWWQGREARKLVEQGLVHAVATDCHSEVDIVACRKGLKWLRSSVGDQGLVSLMRDNPERILKGELPVIG